MAVAPKVSTTEIRFALKGDLMEKVKKLAENYPHNTDILGAADEMEAQWATRKQEGTPPEQQQCHSHFRTPDEQLLRCQLQSEPMHDIHESGDWEWKDEASTASGEPPAPVEVFPTQFQSDWPPVEDDEIARYSKRDLDKVERESRLDERRKVIKEAAQKLDFNSGLFASIARAKHYKEAAEDIRRLAGKLERK